MAAALAEVVIHQAAVAALVVGVVQAHQVQEQVQEHQVKEIMVQQEQIQLNLAAAVAQVLQVAQALLTLLQVTVAQEVHHQLQVHQ
jgi:hypothetical protein